MGDVDLTQLNLLNKLFLCCLLDPLKHHVVSKLYLTGENPDNFVARNDFVRGKQFDKVAKSRDYRLFLKIMAHTDCVSSLEEKSVALSLLELANRLAHEPHFDFHRIMKVTDLAKRLFRIIPPIIPRDTRLLEETCEDLINNLKSR